MKKFRGGVLLLALIVILCLFVACSSDAGTPEEDYYSTYCILEPFDNDYAQVTFKTSEMVYPSVCTIDGKEYTVAVINGFENPEIARSLSGTLEIKDGIMAINSNAFAKAENVSQIILPTSCQSLGTNSLPSNFSEITLPLEAAKDLYRAISNKDNLNTITIVGGVLIGFEGEFKNLRKVQVVGTNANAKVYWSTLPSFTDTAGAYFDAWYDSKGNKISEEAEIANLNTTISVGSKQYYLYEVATSKFSEVPLEPEDGPSQSGFYVPYFMLASEAKYSFTFTSKGYGLYFIKPNTTSGVKYELALDSEKLDLELNEDGEWKIKVEDRGTYIFTCSYKDPGTGEDLGFGQITFTY